MVRAVFKGGRSLHPFSGMPMADDAGKQESSPLDEFSKRLDAARGAGSPENDASAERGKAMGRGFRLASELMAAMIVGPLLGWGFDRLAGTSPFGLLAGVFLGFAAGMRNAARAMKEGAPPAKTDDS